MRFFCRKYHLLNVEWVYLKTRIEKNPKAWNEVVDRSPYSVLFHRYELCEYATNPLPLTIEEKNHRFLFPLNVVELMKTFRLATSPIYDYASILPDSEEAVDLIPQALDHAINFLRELKIDYLSTCVPPFWSKQYAFLLESWFREHNASVQTMYAHIIETKNTTFEDIWRHRFEKHARGKVRKAEREGVSIIEIETEHDIYKWIEDIYECNLSALQRQNRQGAYPDSNKEVYLSELVSDKRRLGQYFRIYGAIYHRHLIAYWIVHEYNKLMEVTKAMSHTRFLRKCPNDATIAHIVKEACDKGMDLVEYGLDRVAVTANLRSIHSSIFNFKVKFGFKEIPISIFRLGLTHRGKIIQYLYSARECIIMGVGFMPESAKNLIFRLHAPRRRWLSRFLSG